MYIEAARSGALTMYTLTIVNSTGTHRSTHDTLCRALAAYDVLEPDALDLVTVHWIASSGGHYIGQSLCGSIVTLARNLH